MLQNHRRALVIAAALLAAAVLMCAHHGGRRAARWEIRAIIFAFVMALSRVYLRAHWLSDTVAGGLLGSGPALGWPALLAKGSGVTNVSSRPRRR